MNLSGREKATIFLSILGSDTSSAILRYLPPELSDLIASSLSQLPTPTPEALGEVFSDFRSYIALPPMRGKTPENPAMTIPQVMEREMFKEQGEKNEKDALLTASSKKIAFLLSDERPQIAAFVLSLFPSMQKEEILMNITSGREQIDEFLGNLKTTDLTEKIKDKLVKYFAEKI